MWNTSPVKTTKFRKDKLHMLYLYWLEYQGMIKYEFEELNYALSSNLDSSNFRDT